MQKLRSTTQRRGKSSKHTEDHTQIHRALTGLWADQGQVQSGDQVSSLTVEGQDISCGSPRYLGRSGGFDCSSASPVGKTFHHNL